MAVYIGYLLLAGLQIPLFKEKNGINDNCFNKNAYLSLCCIELIILVGIRGYTIGADTEVYLAALNHYSGLSLSEVLTAKLVWPFDFEWGYFTLTKLCSWANLGNTSFLFIIAIIIYIPLFKTIKKYSLIPYVSILCYFALGMFTYSLGIFRQMIAISIVLCGWNYIVERKLWKYIIVVGIAMLFHTTAIIAIVLYILYGINWERITWLLLGIEIFLLLFGRTAVGIALKLLPKYIGFVGGKYDQQGGSYIMLILLNVILFVSVFYMKKNNAQERMTICALILAVCCQAIGYSMAIFGRIVPYFSIYIMFAIPNIIVNIDNRWRIQATTIIILFLFALTYLEFDGNKYVTPYYTFFQSIR